MEKEVIVRLEIAGPNVVKEGSEAQSKQEHQLVCL